MIRKGTQFKYCQVCELLEIHRSGLYYEPKDERELNVELMREMDEHYLHHPFKRG